MVFESSASYSLGRKRPIWSQNLQISRMDKLKFTALYCCFLLLILGCTVTSREPAPSLMGTPASLAALHQAMTQNENVVSFSRIKAADWEVPLSGLINLQHPKAIAAGLEDKSEKIGLYFYSIIHPDKGHYLIDSGVEQRFKSDSKNAVLRGFIASMADIDKMVVAIDTKDWLSSQAEPVKGVFLTHLHLDHILGLPDVDSELPVYIGPNEHSAKKFDYLLLQGITDEALLSTDLQSLSFQSIGEAGITGVLDVFGDGSFFALHVPGHTPGNLAFVAITKDGPVLVTGDSSHTKWGWENAVEPGSFSADLEMSGVGLLALKDLVVKHPTTKVYFGHK